MVVLLMLAACLRASDAPASELIVPLDDTRVQVAGRIMVERSTRTVQFPAQVNQHHGLIEYLLVHAAGKRHEALLITNVEPHHLHLACLLAGAPESGTTTRAVTLTITWQAHGPEKRVAPEVLMLPATHDGSPITGESTAPARWIYHGSHFTNEGFAAQREGNLIALQADASALMQAPGLQACEFVPAAQRLPPVGTPVSLIITFPVAQEVP